MDKILVIPHLTPQTYGKIQMKNSPMLWRFKSISKFNLTQRSGIVSLSRLLFYSILYSVVLYKINFPQKKRKEWMKEAESIQPVEIPIPIFCTVCALNHPYRHPCQLSPARTCYRQYYPEQFHKRMKQRSSPDKHITPKFMFSRPCQVEHVTEIQELTGDQLKHRQIHAKGETC